MQMLVLWFTSNSKRRRSSGNDVTGTCHVTSSDCHARLLLCAIIRHVYSDEGSKVAAAGSRYMLALFVFLGARATSVIIT